jgi:predicted amidohydrolase YtcJ
MVDLIFINGTLLTLDPETQARAEALAVTRGRILAVGPREQVEGFARPETRCVDLAGRTLIPGFNDAHIHVWKVGHLLTSLLDVRGAESLDDLRRDIREFASRLPEGAWLQARGYNEATLREGRHPTRHDLDAVLPDRPVFLQRTCAHIAVVNSKALELAGITAATDAPPGGVIDRDEGGEPTGVLRETALGLVKSEIPQPSETECEAMIGAAGELLLSLGITSATDPAVMPDVMAVYRSMDERGALPLRLSASAIRRPDGGGETLPLPERHVSDTLRVDSVKFFADGGLSGGTAALRVPYRHEDTRGILRFEEEELFELAREAHDAGLRISTHVIGDAAIDMVLAVLERLASRGTGPSPRLEHFGLPDAEQLRRAARLRAFAVPQPIFLDELGGNFLRCLPEVYLPRVYPVRAMLDAGLRVALSSDAPVVRDASPLRGIRAAVTRCTAAGEPLAPEQAISAEEALFAYTAGGALAGGEEANRGTLTPGKWADLAVLSENPLAVEPERLTEIRVDMTFVGGELVHEW